MPDGLQPVAVGLEFLQHASLVRAALHEQLDRGDGKADADGDDGEGAVSPAEVRVGVEEVGDGGAGEGTGDERGAVEAEHDHTVAQGGHVGEHDVDDVQEADVTGPVHGVGGDVRLHVAGDGLHDEGDDVDEQHEEETLDATEDVDNLGEGQREAAAEDGGNDVGAGEEAVLAELGRDVRVERALHRVGDGVDERHQVQTIFAESVSMLVLFFFLLKRIEVSVTISIAPVFFANATGLSSFSHFTLGGPGPLVNGHLQGKHEPEGLARPEVGDGSGALDTALEAVRVGAGVGGSGTAGISGHVGRGSEAILLRVRLG